MSRKRLPAPVLRAGTRLSPRLFSALPAPILGLLVGAREVVVDGNTLDPTLQLFCNGLRLSGVTGIVADEDPLLSRTLMHDTCTGLGGAVRPVGIDNLSIPGPAGPIPVRRYRSAEQGPALVYFHGGGYVLGDLDSYDALCSRICQDAGVQVFSVDYRLAPEHPAPAAVEDCCATYAWIAGHAGELGILEGRIGVGGDSAGGGLAAVVAQWARGADVPAPVLQWLLYPVTELAAQTRSRTLFSDGYVLTGADMDYFHRTYLGGWTVAVTDPRVSPLLADDLSGLPPALVITAGFDPLRDEGDHYAAALRRAGVPVDLHSMGSMTHGFMNFAALGGGVERSVSEVISALRARFGHG